MGSPKPNRGVRRMRASASLDGGERKKRRRESTQDKLEYFPSAKVSNWVCEGRSAVSLRLSSRITRAVSLGLSLLSLAVVRRIALASPTERVLVATLLAAEVLASGKTALVLLGPTNLNALKSLSTVSSLGPYGVGVSALSNHGIVVIESHSIDDLPEQVVPRDIVVLLDTSVDEETLAAVRKLMPMASLLLLAPSTTAALRAPIAAVSEAASTVSVAFVGVGGESKVRRLLRLATQTALASVWRFATWQEVAYWAEALLVIVPSVKIVTDGDTCVEDFNASARRGETVVFLTSKNLVPETAGAVVLVDPITAAGFAEIVVATRDFARTPHIVVFVDRGINEGGYLASLEASAAGRHCLPTWERLPNVHAAVGGLLWKKVASQTKRLFTLNSKAFESYRAFMRYLSNSTPSDIFQGFRRHVDDYAKQFGLDEAPPLDLRTKDTSFRPVEDIMRTVVDARKKRYRRMKQIATSDESDATTNAHNTTSTS